jgi:hypothetical protein
VKAFYVLEGSSPFLTAKTNLSYLKIFLAGAPRPSRWLKPSGLGTQLKIAGIQLELIA